MFLVVFRNRKRADIDYAEYEAEADRMLELARMQPGRRRVDVHEQRFDMRSVETRTQGPVAMRAVVHRDSRERVPLAEQHTIAEVTFRVDHRKRRPAGELSRSRYGENNE